MNARRTCRTRSRRDAARTLVALLTATILAAAVATASEKSASGGAQQRVYRIALTYPFPPWGVGPLEGVDFDLLTAICAANAPMKCVLEDRPSGDCVDTDESGHMVIGPALASGAVDGCMEWFDTDERKRLGGEFSEGYSRGPVTQLIAADGDTTHDGLAEGDSLGGADVGFIAGFFTDPSCLGRHYSGFGAGFYDSDEAGRDEMVMDLLSVSGGIQLAFWDNTETVPAGTHLVGAPITDCGPLLSLITFPPSTSRPHQSDALRRDFDCGLALIRGSGQMQEICNSSTYPGGDPTCVFEGPPPTVQCLAENGMVP